MFLISLITCKFNILRQYQIHPGEQENDNSRNTTFFDKSARFLINPMMLSIVLIFITGISIFTLVF